MAKILIIEDDWMLACSLSEWLESQGHRPEVVHDGQEGLDMLLHSGFELAIVDWQLPGLEGVEVCSRYRQAGGRIPLLMMTQKSTADEKSLGLDSGADDYLPKPFDSKELGARIRALLRRASGLFTNKREIRGLVLDRGTCCLSVNGRSVKLMPREFDLLEFLLRHPDNYFTGDQLLDNVWGSNSDAGLEALRTCINRLRNRVDTAGQPSIIENSKGWGYKISDRFIQSADSAAAADSAGVSSGPRAVE